MTLFNPIVEGRESAYYRSSSMETIFIKAHGLLFTGESTHEFSKCVQQLLNGLFDSYISRVTSKFKEQGVFAALSNISSLFEYGILRAKGASRSTLRLAFEEMLSQRGAVNADQDTDNADKASLPQPLPSSVEPLTSREREASMQMIRSASDIAFATFTIALLRIGDRNVYPLVHVYFVFVYSLIEVEKAMIPIEARIPWAQIAKFLNSLFTSETKTTKVMNGGFPKPGEGHGRPLPEDFLMRGQLWTKSFFPDMWFVDAAVDDEERILELPSMAAPRVERLLWLGHRMAACKRWIFYDEYTQTFTETQYVKDFPPPDTAVQEHFNTPQDDQDSIMSGIEDDENVSLHMPDSPPTRQESPVEFPSPETQLRLSSDIRPKSSRRPNVARPHTITPRKILTKEDVRLADHKPSKHEVLSPLSLRPVNVDSEEWLKREDLSKKAQRRKIETDPWASDPRKLDIVDVLDMSDGRDSTKV